MRNKKIVTLFTAALLAGSLGTGAIIASAGTVESKPAGDGLITSKSELNLTNFKIVETEAGDADAYVAGKSNDYVIEYITRANGRKCWSVPPSPRRSWRKRARR